MKGGFMKRHSTLALCLITALAVSGFALQQQGVTDLFQQAVHMEEVKGDLETAIPLYERIARESSDKSLAARAQLRVGLCYEKLGQEKASQAQEAFQKVLDTYPGQTEVVQVAKERLNVLMKIQSAARGGERKMELRRVLSVTSPHDYHQVSPDGRYVAYFDYGEMCVVLLELATGKTRNLKCKIDENEGEGESWFFRWSPDSRSIVCNWWRYATFEWADLRLLFVDGSSPRRIFQGDYEEVYPFSWSSDGQRILSIFCTIDNAPRRMGIISVEDGSVHFLKTQARGLMGSLKNYEFSPDNRYIVYDSDADPDSLNRDIYLISLDEKNHVPLVTHPADDALLGWSPDGTRVLFTSNRRGTRDLWAVEVANMRPAKNPEVIKRGIGEIESAGITQSGSLYFTTSNAMQDIYVAGIDQKTGKIVTPQKRMIFAKQGNIIYPQYSPDGKFLAYFRGGSVQGKTLCVCSLETEEERCFPVTMDARLPRWSPDGRFVYFSAFHTGRQMRMFRMDRETGKYSAVIPDESKDAVYIDQFIGCSKDGKFIYYTHSPESKPICQIIARDANGVELTLYEAKDRLPWTAALSPDGSRLVAVSRAVHREIIVLPTSGNGPSKMLYKFEQDGGHPAWLSWTPDGRSVIFTKRKKGAGWSLWRISAEGGEPQNLGINTHGIRGISIHPDGKQLAFSSLVPGTGASELWALENFLPTQSK